MEKQKADALCHKLIDLTNNVMENAYVIRKMYIQPSQVILQRRKMWHLQRMPGNKQTEKIGTNGNRFIE